MPCPSEGKDSALPTKLQAPVTPSRKPLQVPGPQDQINEEEIGNLSEKELMITMIQNLRSRMEAQIEKIQEKFDKELQEIKNK